MPNRDRTGPTGAGPMTGRGLGPCSPNGKQNIPTVPFLPRPNGVGRGQGGTGRGLGRGRRIVNPR